MTDKFLALDRDGLTAPSGKIVGIADSTAELVAAGFPGSTYRGNRRVRADTTQAWWTNDVQVGWYYIVDGSTKSLTRSRPATAIETLKASVHTMLNAGDALEVAIIKIGAYQDASLTQQAHQWRWRSRGGSYLVALDRQYTMAERTNWAIANAMGPTDVVGDSIEAKVINYFTHFSGVSPTDWLTFANPSDATRTTLSGAVIVPGTVPVTVDLAERDWVDTIQPGNSE